MKYPFFKVHVLVVTLIWLGGCVNTSGVSYAPGTENLNGRYDTFTTVSENMPDFLAPMMESSLTVALTEQGLNPTSAGGDLSVTLRYVQEDIGADSSLDDFEGHLAPGGNVRFVAKVMVEVRENGSDAIIWSGSIQRIHDVDAGEYMHTGRASMAILDNFRKLLADFKNS